jgi:ABC-type glucose/galactose transport system permease subunit
VNRAILLCTTSAIAICLVVAGLFIAALADLNVGRWIAVAFILAMLLLISGLAAFLLEIRLALYTIRVPVELLEREEDAGNRLADMTLFRK